MSGWDQVGVGSGQGANQGAGLGKSVDLLNCPTGFVSTTTVVPVHEVQGCLRRAYFVFAVSTRYIYTHNWYLAHIYISDRG